MVSLNQILKRIQEIAEAHKQVAEYGQGQKYDVSASSATTYPCVWATPNGGTPDLSGNLFNYAITLWVMGKEQSDGRNQIEIENDTILILTDILAQLDHDDFREWSIASAGPATPFVDADNDTVSGVYSELVFSAFFGSDICSDIIGLEPADQPIITEDQHILAWQ